MKAAAAYAAWTLIVVIACGTVYEACALPYELGLEDGLNACPQGRLEPTYSELM